MVHYVVLELGDLKALAENVEADVVLKRLIIRGTAELAAIYPAREKTHDALVDVREGERFFVWWDGGPGEEFGKIR